MMTRKEVRGKEQIEKFLGQQGYPSYAQILHRFDLNITQDPGVVAFFEPSRARIVVNGTLDLRSLSVVIRHEILHQYLAHENRLLQHLAQKHGLPKDELTDTQVGKLKNELYSNKMFNIAADYEISNRGYTPEDKESVRNIIYNDRTVSGLVTEDEHPEWVDMTVEEMYDELTKQLQQDKQQAQQGGGQGEGQQGQGQSGQGQQGDSGDEQGTGQSGDSSEESSDGKQGNQQGRAGSQKGTPQIGDRGDAATQAAEDAERAANAVTDDAGNAIDPTAKKDLEDAVDDMNDADSAEEKAKAAEEVQKRIQDAIDSLNDPKMAKQLENEVREKIAQENRAKVEREIERYKQSGSYKFKLSLDKFIKDEVDTLRDGTWRKFNKTYANSSIIKKGVATVDGPVPLINVYFDMSGSWDDNKIKSGEQAMSVLEKYKNKGEIKVKTYYFSNHVETEREVARAQGGTHGQPIMDHIKQTKPTNVIIMTDSDISDITTPVTVPGAVWLLFKGGRSQNLIDNIHGKKETHVMDIE